MLRKIFSKVSGKSEHQLANEALRAAVIKGDLPKVARELARGADVNAEDVNKLTPVYFAAAGGHADILRLLLDRGGNADAGTPGEGQGSALTVAVYFGHNDCAKLLMERGARHDLTDYDGRTPLHLAVDKANSVLFMDMIDRGVQVNSQNRSGNSPLHEAITNNNETFAIVLVKAGADVASKDRWGAPAEDRAVAKQMKELGAAIREEKERPAREAAAAKAAAEALAAALAKADTLQSDTAVLPPLQVRRRTLVP